MKTPLTAPPIAAGSQPMTDTREAEKPRERTPAVEPEHNRQRDALKRIRKVYGRT
ncbi:hypothetical protein [Sinorhizobium glycinis]|uniref:hypothetical protein n=1 Tax=Sinorhizobium glycinis TaxID=1472378 RepID=UPI000A6C9739|nr:hypothetical protein [Sinorhizobium glycinis]